MLCVHVKEVTQEQCISSKFPPRHLQTIPIRPHMFQWWVYIVKSWMRPACSWLNFFILCSFYHLQRSCEGYVFTGVCLSTGGWGCLPQRMLGYHIPPGADTPPRADAPPEADTPKETDTPSPPRADTPKSRHPRDMATAAGGMHPTGMHSCSEKFWPINRFATPFGVGAPTPSGKSWIRRCVEQQYA